MVPSTKACKTHDMGQSGGSGRLEQLREDLRGRDVEARPRRMGDIQTHGGCNGRGSLSGGSEGQLSWAGCGWDRSPVPSGWAQHPSPAHAVLEPACAGCIKALPVESSPWISALCPLGTPVTAWCLSGVPPCILRAAHAVFQGGQDVSKGD